MFVKGQSGNPKGRPPVPEIEALRQAIRAVQQKKGKTLLQHAIEESYKDNKLLVAILRKILPDLQSVSGKIGLGGELIINVVKFKDKRPSARDKPAK